MSIGIEFHTKEGNVFIADVVGKKIMRIASDGKKSDWYHYSELKDGQVGNNLIICRPEVAPTMTSEIVKLGFPKLGE
jgi:sugar lactone lactonase YvrE